MSVTLDESTGADLRQRVRDRLTVLRHEHQLGESRLRDLAREEAVLRQTVLRIGGAIQVLEEILAGPADDDA
jgi:hypothetical protein